MSLAVKQPPYNFETPLGEEEVRSLSGWLEEPDKVLALIKETIIGNVTEDDFNAIPDKNEFYKAILDKLMENWDENEPEESKHTLIKKVVKITLRRFEININTQLDNKIISSFPLGTLASDHAGYISYDLGPVIIKLEIMKERGLLENPEMLFYVYPFGKEELKIDVLDQGRFTRDVIFAKIPIDLSIPYDELKKAHLPSMQNPNLDDWYLSPASFALNPEYFIGAEGCENLYPANFATHDFRFFQIIRGGKTFEVKLPDMELQAGQRDNRFKPEVRCGYSLEYLVTWQPLGHTLGQIVYSLPLAPGEIVNIAVIDWARKSIDSRDEDLTVTEQLVHNTHRDRNISETVNAAMHEWQRGGSFMAGVAGSYGAEGTGISGAMGGGYSTSSGDRSVHASTVQQISDAFAQASSSVRELRSTIVIQSNQQEHAKAEGRVVANHNHSHALTMLYYEVLRHYKVTTKFMRVRPSILVQYNRIDFSDWHNIIKYRKILTNVLLEERYLGCFDAAQSLYCSEKNLEYTKAQAAKAPNLNDINEVGNIRLIIKTKKATSNMVRVYIRTKNDEKIQWVPDSPLWHKTFYTSASVFYPDSLPDQADSDGPAVKNYRQDGQSNLFVIKPSRKVIWKDVEDLVLKVSDEAGDPTDWEIESVEAISSNASGDKTWIMVNSTELISIPRNSQKYFHVEPYKDIPGSAADSLPPNERCCIELLKDHLVNNAFHYNKAIWLQEDPNERAYRFRGTSADLLSILDRIDNRIIDVLGDYAVFPARADYGDELDILSELKVEAKVEKLMTLPTRGVFGEAKLGHCNASEEIDDTRFWDWQTSPITEQAPGIDNMNINNSRNAAPNLIPSQLPSSVVNIVNPQGLPDPTGMTSAMSLMGKSDIFRDMSVSKEVEDLLEKLADKSVGISEASNKAKEIQRQRDSSKGSAPVQVNQLPQPQTTTPSEAQQEIKVIENQAAKGNITQDEKKDKVKKSIDKMQGDSKTSVVTVTVNFKHSISGVLDGEFTIEFIGPVIGSLSTRTHGGVGAGNITIETGSEYVIQIIGKRTKLPISMDTIAHIPSITDNPAFDIDVSKHITKRDVPINANIVAKITKGAKRINLTVVAEEVPQTIKVTVKLTGSGTLKRDMEGELGLKLAGIDAGHVKAGLAQEITIGGEAAVELPIEFKRLTGNVTAAKNELVL